MTPNIREYFREKGITSIDNLESDDQWVWCIVKNCNIAQTKNGKSYLRIKVYGESGITKQCFCWNFDIKKGHKLIPDNTLIISRFKSSDFGLSTFWNGIDIISEKE